MDASIDYVRFIPETRTAFSPGIAFPLSGAAIDLWFSRSLIFPSGAFTDYLSVSRASVAYANTAAGVLTSFGNNTLRITDLGLLSEVGATNVALWCRDLTNAVWIKSNVTATLNQTGADGAANSATSLTATAGNGTVLQSITLASSGRIQSAFVKRLSGSGTINMTTDGGTTWVVITPTTSYTQLSIPQQTVTNPQVGFRIVTSGDSIAVDFVQNETQFHAADFTSPILTTTTSATRADDVITGIGTLNTALLTEPFSVVAEVKANFAPGQGRVVGYDTGLVPLTEKLNDDFGVTNYDGSVQLNAVLGNSLSMSGGVKVGTAQSVTGRSLVGGGGTVATDAGGSVGTVTYIGNDSGGNQFGGYIKRLTVWTSRLADATLQGFTYP